MKLGGQSSRRDFFFFAAEFAKFDGRHTLLIDADARSGENNVFAKS